LRIIWYNFFDRKKGGQNTMTENEKLLHGKNAVYTNTVEHEDIYSIVRCGGIFTSSEGTPIEYRIFVPYDYDVNKKYPLLLSMHGAGEEFMKDEEFVSSSMRVLCNLFNLRNSPITQAVIVCPRCPQEPDGAKWVNAEWSDGCFDMDKAETPWIRAVLELVGDIEKRYSIDADRRYIGGLSMGGFATWYLISRYTELFAGAIAICGGADVRAAEKLRDFPVYTAHGAQDDTVPVEGTRAMVKALRDAGSTKVHYREIPDGDHIVWHAVTQDPTAINWLFEQRLSDRK